MYQNTENLELGKDYYDINTGEYKFTYISDGCDEIEVEGIPKSFVKAYGTTSYDVEVQAYVKGTNELLSESEVCDICYEDIMVTKERLEELEEAKIKIQAIIDEANLSEPFIFEGGQLWVGKEHVLSTHINAGYDHGWISSSICW
jgi:hypothetical protein